MREKIFARPRGVPLDRNAKARVMHNARAYNSRWKRPGQHWGPLTRATLQILEALLWGFHNARSGDCYPSYESIAAKARCHRDTVYEAIKALEAADVMTWANCFTKGRVIEGGQVRWKVFRTSNAYLFRDPLPCHASKSEYPPRTIIQESISKREDLAHMPLPLMESLKRLGEAIAERTKRTG